MLHDSSPWTGLHRSAKEVLREPSPRGGESGPSPQAHLMHLRVLSGMRFLRPKVLGARQLQFEDPAGVLWEIEMPEDYARFEVIVER